MALRYGTVPIVRLTGGLKDTVKVYDSRYRTGTGFGFEEYSMEALRDTLQEAMAVYRQQPEEWNRIAERGMRENYSWNTSCTEYEKLYAGM